MRQNKRIQFDNMSRNAQGPALAIAAEIVNNFLREKPEGTLDGPQIIPTISRVEHRTDFVFYQAEFKVSVDLVNLCDLEGQRRLPYLDDEWVVTGALAIGNNIARKDGSTKKLVLRFDHVRLAQLQEVRPWTGPQVMDPMAIEAGICVYINRRTRKGIILPQNAPSPGNGYILETTFMYQVCLGGSLEACMDDARSAMNRLIQNCPRR